MRYGELQLKLRQAAHMSLRDLAKAVRLSPVYLSDIECFQRRPPASATITQIAEKLGADPNPLLRAALEERDAIELALPDENTTDARREAALALARGWANMNDADLLALAQLVEKSKKEDA